MQSYEKWLTTCNSIETCPVKLALLDFDIFAQYVVTRRNMKTGHYLSISYYEKLRASLMHLFCCANFDIGDEMYNRLANLMAGMKRTVAQAKQAKGEACNSGKSSMSLATYQKLCQIFMKSDKPEHIFAHCFLTLEWSLMARSDSCVRLHANHLE